MNDCTYDVLGEICIGCKCGRYYKKAYRISSVKAKLTFAQSRLLLEIGQQPYHAASYRGPAFKLVSMKLAEWKGSILHPTEKGRAVAISLKDDAGVKA